MILGRLRSVSGDGLRRCTDSRPAMRCVIAAGRGPGSREMAASGRQRARVLPRRLPNACRNRRGGATDPEAAVQRDDDSGRVDARSRPARVEAATAPKSPPGAGARNGAAGATRARRERGEVPPSAAKTPTRRSRTRGTQQAGARLHIRQPGRSARSKKRRSIASARRVGSRSSPSRDAQFCGPARVGAPLRIPSPAPCWTIEVN